jgi:hypothetical protein
MLGMDTVNPGAPDDGRGIWAREFRPGHVIGALGICVGVATQLNNQMSDKFLCLFGAARGLHPGVLWLTGDVVSVKILQSVARLTGYEDKLARTA